MEWSLIFIWFAGFRFFRIRFAQHSSNKIKQAGIEIWEESGELEGEKKSSS